jgi:DNA transposition AAA+ family ATPase
VNKDALNKIVSGLSDGVDKRRAEWAAAHPSAPQQQQQQQDATRAPADAAVDKLMEARRVVESRTVRMDAKSEDLSEAECREIVERVKAYAKEKGLSQSQLARKLFLSASVVSQVFKGDYPGDTQAVALAMARWYDRQQQADAQPKVVTFVTTGVFKRIRLAVQQTIAMADDADTDSRIGLVWGDPGSGKSLALRAIAEAEDGIYVEATHHSASPVGILEKIARAMRVSGAGNARYASHLYDALVNKLRGSGKLIVVDEIHALLETREDKVFHTLRRLSDETGVPQVWCATCDLMAELGKRSLKRQPLAQISSRIAVKMHVTQPIAAGRGGDGGEGKRLYTVEEILKIYGQGTMRLTEDGGRFLARICTNPHLGLLRACTAIVRHATTINRLRHKELTATMLWEACQVLYTEAEQDNVWGLVREEMPQRRSGPMSAAG